MADYKIIFKASVDKDLADLPKNVVVRVWQRLEVLNRFQGRHSSSKVRKA